MTYCRRLAPRVAAAQGAIDCVYSQEALVTRGASDLLSALRVADGLFIPLDADRPLRGAAGGIGGTTLSAIRLGPAMAEQVMPGPPLAIGTEGGEVDRANHDLFAGTGVGLSQNAAIVIDNHAPARPGEGRVMRQARGLVRGHDVGHVLQ